MLVTENVTVQLPLLGIVMPEKFKVVVPAAKLFGEVPTQEPPTAPPEAVILTKVSVNEALVNAPVLLLLIKVNVTVEFPLSGMNVGENAFVIDGGAITVNVAVLLAVPAEGVCAVVTPEVVFECVPAALLVTEKVTVQEPFAGIVIPLKLKLVAPAANVFGEMPAQVPETAPPAALIFVNASVNEAFVRAIAFVLPRVKVTVDEPPA